MQGSRPNYGLRKNVSVTAVRTVSGTVIGSKVVSVEKGYKDLMKNKDKTKKEVGKNDFLNDIAICSVKEYPS